jgi:hypothetical protein
MPIQVEVPNVGTVEFPDDTPQDEIKSVLDKHASTPAPASIKLNPYEEAYFKHGVKGPPEPSMFVPGSAGPEDLGPLSTLVNTAGGILRDVKKFGLKPLLDIPSGIQRLTAPIMDVSEEMAGDVLREGKFAPSGKVLGPGGMFGELPLAAPEEKGVIPSLSRTAESLANNPLLLAAPGSKAVQALFGAQAAASIPQAVEELRQAKTPAEVRGAATDLAINAGFAGLIGSHLARKTKAVLKKGEPDAIQRPSEQILSSLQPQPVEGAGQVPAEVGSPPLGQRGGQAQAQLPTQAVTKPASRKWQVTVQSPETITEGAKTVSSPGYVQVDDVTGGQNHWSLGPEGLREQGVEVPDFSKLPQGKYDWDEAVKLLRETAQERGGRVDILTSEDDFLAAERQALAESEKQGSPAKLVSKFEGEEPNQPFAGQFMRATPKGVEIRRKEFREWLQNVPPERRAEAIKQRVAEEHIHRQVTPEDAKTYWDSLTGLEQAAETRQYTGYWSRGKLKAERGVEFSDTQLGHEAVRRRLQRLQSGTTSEIAEAALKERWTLRSLDVLEDTVRTIREKLGTKASGEGIEALNRATSNLAAARTALGDTPAAYDKRRKQKEGSEQVRLPLPEAKAGEARPGAVELGARPFTALDLDKAGYQHLEAESERIRSDYESNPTSHPKPLSFEAYKTDLQNKYGDLKPGQLYESFSKNLYNRLFNASGRTLEALQRSLGVKRVGRIPDPPQRQPLLQSEGASGEARAQLAAERAGTASRQRYRIGAISQIARKLLDEAESQSEAKPGRSTISPEDLRHSGPSKEPSFWEVSRDDLSHPELLGQRLAQDARRSKRDPVSLTKRLTALLDRQTGKTYLVSTYAHGRSGAMLLDPSVSTVKAHRPLSSLLGRYRPVASLLLDEPARNFKQTFDSLSDFENRIGTDARRAASQSFDQPLREGEIDPGGSWEQGAPITDSEAGAILDHIYEENGIFDSPEDVKASLAALKEDTNYQVLSGYRKLADVIIRNNPDLSDDGVRNQLAQQIYENHATATGEGAFETFIRRTMAQGGAEDRPDIAVRQDAGTPQAATGKELTMPLERRPPTDIRPENVPPGSLPEKRPAPPMPEGTPVGAKSDLPPAAFNKHLRAVIDEVYDTATHELESGRAALSAGPIRDLISRGIDDAEVRTNNFARKRENDIRLVSQKKRGAIGRAVGMIEGDKDVLRATIAMVQAEAVRPDGSINNMRKGQITTFKRMVRTGITTAQAMIRTGQAPPNIIGLQGMTATRVRRIGRAWERSNTLWMKALDYAYSHWDDPVMQETARRAKLELDAQYQREIDSGVELANDPNYFPGRYDAEMWLHNSVVFGERSTVWGKHWRQQKKFPTYFHAAENGPYIPATMDGASLVGHRIRQGTRQMMRKAWESWLTRTPGPDGQPIAVEPTWSTAGWTSPDKTYEPIGKGMAKPLLVHPDFSNLIRRLVSDSPIETSPIFRPLLHLQQTLKHTLLIGDFFHLSRVMYYAHSIMGRKADWRGGWTVLDIPESDLHLAVDKGIITAKDAEWGNKPVQFGNQTITRRQLAAKFMGGDRDQPIGLNVGKIQDALYKDLLTQLSPGAGPIRTAVQRALDPTIGKYNRFLFDKLTRGFMMETAVREFERQSVKLPNADPHALMRDISRDTNNYYGNIGKQGWLKSKFEQDFARLLFLAPSWVEGLVKKETIGAMRLSGLSKLTGQRAGLTALGTTGKGMGQGLAALFVLTQAINLFSRGKTTFQNEEHGHKLDAYIPLAGGFWFSPLSVFAELTHDLWRYRMANDKTWADAIQQIAGNKESALLRMVIIGRTGRSPTGVKYTTTLGRAKAMGEALLPIPITFGKAFREVGHLIAPKAIAANPPGVLGRQAFATMGLKVEPKESARAEMFDLAKRWAKDTGHHKETGWIQEQTDEASYSKLRSAVNRGDESEAKSLYDELRKSHKPQQIRKGMMPFTVVHTPETDTYTRHYKPFSGSKRTESAFIRSLTPTQRKTYEKARREQDEAWNKFRVLYEKWETSK